MMCVPIVLLSVGGCKSTDKIPQEPVVMKAGTARTVARDRYIARQKSRYTNALAERAGETATQEKGRPDDARHQQSV